MIKTFPRRKSSLTGATAIGMAVLLADGAAAQTGSADAILVSDLAGVRSSRLLANGELELVMEDGRTIRFAAEDVVRRDGALAIEASAVAEAGLAAGTAAGGGISTGLLIGGLGALAAGGAAIASGGSGEDAPPPPPPPPVNTAPTITSAAAASVAENTAGTVLTVTGTDPESNPLRFSISGGPDATAFVIDATTGALRFATPPNFEAPTDADRNNVFDVTVAANDGTNTVTQAVRITVTNVNDVAPVITSAAAFSVVENQTAVFTATATDVEGGTLTFALSGADAARFAIDAATGVVTFRTAPDFEAPADAGANNVYDIVVTASDGVNATNQAVAITVTNAPNFTGTAGNDVLTGTAAIEEFSGLAGNDRITGAGGADTITTGTGSDRIVYSGDPFDGGGAVLTTPGRQFVGNEDFITDFDFANDVIELNARDFGITGELSFAKLDATAAGATIPNGANVIVLTNAGPPFNAGLAATQVAGLIATDGPGFIVYFNTALNVTRIVYTPNLNDPNADIKILTRHIDLTGPAAIAALNNFTAANFDFDRAPVFTSPAAVSVVENQTAAYTAVAADGDGSTLTYSLSGADAALFAVSATGVVTFRTAPDFEAPGDAGANNVYDIVVTATDGVNATNQAVAITVTNAPNFTGTAGNDVLTGTAAIEEFSGLAGNDRITGAGGADTITTGTGSDRIVYSGDPFDGGGAVLTTPGRQFVGNEDFITDFDFANDVIELNARDFGITGELSFAKLDATAAGATIPNGANVIVLTNAGPPFNAGLAATQVAGLIATDGPGFIVYFNTALNVTRIVYTPNLNDPNADIKILTRHIDLTGPAAIAALNNFTAANFDFDRAPVFTSPAAVSVVENQTAAYTAVAADGDGSTLTYSLSGADAALFAVSATGVVTFRTAPDFEAPADAGANNVYDIVVTATDGVNATNQAVAITVTNAPNFTGTAGNDVLTGTAAIEEFSGLAGNDRITGAGGADTITTGTGSDRIVYSGDPFDGGGAVLTTPGRQFVGNEDFITDFDFATPVTSVAVTTASATTAAVLNAALAGNIYFNLHSATFPAGEVRGQLVLASDGRAANGTGSVTFTSVLNGANEVPAVATRAEGTGSITFTVAADGSVTYTTRIDVRNFDVTQLTVGHLHQGAVGVSGPVVLDLVATARTASGAITGSTDRDVIELNARDFGITGELSFAKLDATAAGATIPNGANVIVLTNAGPPFNAGLAATQVAGLIATDGPGFIVYFNTALNVTRIVYTPNLNDPNADIKILTRHIDLTGPAAIAALNNFTAANFDFTNNAIIGTSANDTLVGTAAGEVISGLAGVDTITTGAGRDAVAFDRTAIGSQPDQIGDFDVRTDRFLLDAADFGVNGPFKFQSGRAANLVNDGSNVIVLLDSDNDANPATPFNARTSAQLIAQNITTAGPGFFYYFNSVLNVNRLAFSQNLADGNAPLTLLGAVTNVTGQDAIAGLASFTAANFAFAGEFVVGTSGNDTLVGTAAGDVFAGLAGVDTITTGAGRDTVAFDRTAIGSQPDQITDFDVTLDRFLLDATEFGVNGPFKFQSGRAANLVNDGSNVIVLLDSDNDANPATPFNARTSAQLIAQNITTAGPGFFYYFNSVLNVNRLAFSQNLADGNAPLTLLGAVTNATGQSAIDGLVTFTAANFAFADAPAAAVASAQQREAVLTVSEEDFDPSPLLGDAGEGSGADAVAFVAVAEPFLTDAIDPPVPAPIELV